MTRSVTVPAAIAGSVALMLSSAPAQAVEPVRESRTQVPLRVVPAAGLPTVQLASTAVSTVSMAPTAKKTATTYTVKRGDTVFAIAARHDLRTADVLAVNGLTARSTIYPGQKLRLTGTSTQKATSTPAKTASASRTYTIRAGDTVSVIAGRHGVSIHSIFSANKLSGASIIYPGQKLTIPGKKAAATSPAPAAASSKPATTAIVKLSAEQTGNAKLIINVGRGLGVSDRAITIALGTAMQESSLRNLAGGDRDSIGLFQQRPSTGWGTAAQIRDAVRSTKVFFGGSSDPNGYRTRGLLDIPGWQNMSFTQAAQAVQISAYPTAYAKWEIHAKAWLASLG